MGLAAYPELIGMPIDMRINADSRVSWRPKVQIADPGLLIKARLSCDQVVWPEQAVPLVGYMAWPNDPIMRDRWLEAHRRDDQSAISDLARGLTIVEQHWARAADIVHLHYDLVHGRHQERRGGASVGKAISLIDANAKSIVIK